VREIRKHGSEGGEARVFPTPIDEDTIPVIGKALWIVFVRRWPGHPSLACSLAGHDGEDTIPFTAKAL
jgi:hypothetical protein